MQSTMDLLKIALTGNTAAGLARELNITRQAFYNAQRKQRLSPVLAGNLAMKVGEDADHWIAVAALEAEPESELLTRLRNASNRWRKR